MKDFYKILGVLPSAEEIVIRAAYRVLAQRYHPDRWQGSSEEATKKMASLNEAFAVLSDTGKRQKYDKERRATDEDSKYDDSDQTTNGMVDAFGRDWSIATEYYADITSLAKRLDRVSFRLGFTFRALLLESKRFEQAREIASRLEAEFLQRYFGNDEFILAFAAQLIADNRKAALKALNDAVRVLGPGLNPRTVVQKICKDHGIERRYWVDEYSRWKGEAILEKLRSGGIGADDVITLLKCCGVRVNERVGLFASVFKFEFQGTLHEYSLQDVNIWIQHSLQPLLVQPTKYEGPTGVCPNCESRIPLGASICPNCRADFGPQSAWRVQPEG